jgi:hypothetical protein
MFKRGQLTLFIIIGIIIVFGVVGYYFLSSSGSYQSVESNARVAGFREDFLFCIESVELEALDFVSVHGGYYKMPSSVYEAFGDSEFSPYYYYEGHVFVPSLARIEDEIANYFDDNINYCFEMIENDFEIKKFSSKGRVKIESGEVVFSPALKFVVSDLDNNYLIDFSREVRGYNSRLYAMHDLADFITSENGNELDYVCFSCINEKAALSGLNVFFESPGDSLDYEYVSITDLNEDNFPVSFEFMNKFPEGLEVEE